MSPAAIVRVRDLRKRLGGQLVLDGISLEVAPGELLCVIGPSGCGKSTLLRCLNLLEIPDEGEIVLAGHVVSRPGRPWRRADEATAHALRAAVGMVFQGFNLFPHRTVLDNVMLAPRVVKRAAGAGEAMALLDKVGLAGLADRYPATLSGGQQQAGGDRAGAGDGAARDAI